MVDINELVDGKNGKQNRRIFWDPEIYQQEMERVFARCWLFLTHESLIPDFGDFVVTKMGEDEVVVWRQKDGSIKVFLNQCTHRGTRLCAAETGNARGMSCAYHGWAFKPDGELASVPCEKESYGPDFSRADYNLQEIAQVDSYKGFIFGCMDASAPSLQDYLGDLSWYIDIWADTPGGIELVGPPSRSIIHANWKTPTENFIGDVYHVGWTHASALMAAVGAAIPQSEFGGENSGIQMTSRYGHGLGVSTKIFGAMLLIEDCPELIGPIEERKAEVEQSMGEKVAALVPGQWDGSIFPNCSYLIGANVFKVWHPIGPDKVEIMTWTVAPKSLSVDAKSRLRTATHRSFGTAGVLESDDIDNMEYGPGSSRGFVTRQGTVSCQMGLGTEREDPDFPGVIGEYVSEHAQRGFYRAYADCMSSADWKSWEGKTANWKKDILGE